MPDKFILNENLCTGCGTCVYVCPKSLLVLNDGRPELPEEKAMKCNQCGQCTAYCPSNACRQALDAGDELPLALHYDPSMTGKFNLFLKSRRSYRSFASVRPVSKQTINEILDVLNYAPTGGNNRKIRYIVVADAGKTHKVRDLITEWMDTDCRKHPVLSKRYDIDSIVGRQRKGKDIILRGAPCVIFAVGPRNHVWGGVDSGIGLMYFNLAAEAHDIGCCFAGYAANGAKNSKELRAFLGIEEEEDCFCALVFGHKTIKPQRIPARPPLNKTIL